MLAPDITLNERYKIVRLIGQGGMGAVYEALDQRLRNRVALKQTTVTGVEMSKAFEREAQLLAGLRHPALPRVIDHFVVPEGQFLVMEYIPGDDLAGMLKARGTPFSPAEVLPWADQLLDALDYLHSQSPPVIHRDIKPQNLKLTPRGEIILLDFGLAKGSIALATQAAQGSSLFGYTPQYAPLEQVQGSGTDARSDLYSLAATLYNLLSGQPPADALARAAAVLNGKADPLRPIHELVPSLPIGLSGALSQALSLRSDDRFRSATAMRRALQASSGPAEPAGPTTAFTGPTVVARQAPSQPPPPTQADRLQNDLPARHETPFKIERRRPIVPIILIALVVVVIGAVLASGMLRGRGEAVAGVPTVVAEATEAQPVQLATDDPREHNQPRREPTMAPVATVEPSQGGEAQQITLDTIIKDEITVPGQHKVYAFDAAPDQQIFIWTARFDRGMDQINLQLLDPNGDLIVSKCLGCGNLGVQSLRQGGRYQLVIGDERVPAVGIYEIRVNVVPLTREVNVPMDVRITGDAPEPGADEISVPGAKNSFSFEAEPDQQIFIWTAKRDKGMDQISLRLLDPNGDLIVSKCLGCGNLGVQTLRQGGTYRLVVGDDTDPATGRYEIRLSTVPPIDEFSSSLPLRVAEGQPGAGAGQIVAPGAKQAFKFEVSPGQQIFVNTLHYDKGMDQISLRLLDPNGDLVVSKCLGCGDMGAQTLRAGGTYSLVIGDDTDPATGVFEFEVTLVQ